VGHWKRKKQLVLFGAAATCWSLWFCRNSLVFDKKHNLSPFVGCLQNCSLALFMDYFAATNFTGHSCCGISTLDASGQGFFYRGTWLAV
jgi:hypothetical protein